MRKDWKILEGQSNIAATTIQWPPPLAGAHVTIVRRRVFRELHPMPDPLDIPAAVRDLAPILTSLAGQVDGLRRRVGEVFLREKTVGEATHVNRAVV